MSRTSPVKSSSRKAKKETLPPKVNSVVDLARILGVSARTIRGWKSAPDTPLADASGRYDVAAWMRWAAKHGKEIPAGGATSKQDWEIERIKKQVEGLELDLRVRRGELVNLVDVKRWGADAVYAFKTEVLAIPTKVAPQVVGLTIADAEQLLRRAICDALDRLNRGPWAHPSTNGSEMTP